MAVLALITGIILVNINSSITKDEHTRALMSKRGVNASIIGAVFTVVGLIALGFVVSDEELRRKEAARMARRGY